MSQCCGVSRLGVSLVAMVCAGVPSAFVRAADDVRFTNPIVRQRADPHVMLHTDGYYYYTATAPEYDRIERGSARCESVDEVADAGVRDE